VSGFALIVAILFVMVAPCATAQEKMTVDMAKVTCRELTEANYDEFVTFIYWMGGYYNGTLHSTVVNLSGYVRAAKKVKTFCQKNPSATVMSSAERALGIKIPRQ
jgi:acid stress chaperone HdeB